MDIENIRKEFPVTNKYAYFDHAAVGPLPKKTVESVCRVTEEKCEGDLHWESWEKTAEAVRQSIANLIGARVEEIALTYNTSEGIAVVANGLTYEKGSNVVTCDMEFPSNLYPWQALTRRQGIELKVIRNRDGTLRMEDFSAAIDPRTRVVAISYVQYVNGFKIDLKELSRIAHENGALVATDAVQAVGEMPVDVSKLDVDFLATSGYKWLLSPISTGFLYVRHELFEELWPTIVGYRSDENSMDFSFREFKPAHTARRYEGGQLNFPGFAGMRESIALLQEVDLIAIHARIRSHVDRVIDGVKRSANVQVKSCLDEAFRSGIVNLACREPDLVAERLLKRGIVISVRGGGLRISPHFYNTEGEIDKLVSELNDIG